MIESSLIIIEGGGYLIEKILLERLSKITYVRSLVNYQSISEVVALLTTREAAFELFIFLMNLLMAEETILARKVFPTLIALKLFALSL